MATPMNEITDAEVEAVAVRLWRAEAEDVGAPASVAANRTSEAFAGQLDDTKQRWRKMARAALTAFLSARGEQSAPTPDDWIPWHGGECPVPEGVKVDVELDNGKVFFATAAWDWKWRHSSRDVNIRAYRISKENGK